MVLEVMTKGPSQRMSIAQCDFCNEFAGGTHNAFCSRYGDRITRTVLATENVRVFPSIGQLVEGYLLITPTDHYSAIDEMPCRLTKEFDYVYRTVKEAMLDSYGPFLCYEHGSRGPDFGGCGIYHAHLHVVPVGGYRDPINELRDRFAYKRIQSFEDIRPETEGLSSYLFYEDVESDRYLFFTGSMPSQYMRRLLATTIGDIEWDWRAAHREARLLRTVKRLSVYFNNLHQLSIGVNLANVGQR